MTTSTDPIHTITTHSLAETERLGERLGAALRDGDLLCLSGPLGAGKTTLTRGLARGWGAVQRVTSPTFTLINEYRRPADATRFFHVDCYRLSGPLDAVTTGLEDALDAPGVVAIEWPERIAEMLPAERLWIAIADAGPGARRFTFRADGARAVKLKKAALGG
jgi:tRNA threonylcarbamoyladenosine biosynthesis protein TsaE